MRGSFDAGRISLFIRVLELAGYADLGYYVGLDVKAMRTQTDDRALKPLASSKEVFLRLVEKVRSFPQEHFDHAARARDYDEL